MNFVRSSLRVVPRVARARFASASAEWQGTLKEGKGTMSIPSKVLNNSPFTFASRFEKEATKTNPEELIGAAHAGCYSMFLGALLDGAKTPAKSIKTTAEVTLGDGPAITKIALKCVAQVPGVDAKSFAETAANAKKNCPISKALGGVAEITLDAKLA
jgi:osmotically inducible protein OsmC